MKSDKMFNKQLVLLFTAVGMLTSLAVMPLLARSRMTFYSFEVILPEEVEAMPGEDVTIDGGILVTGFYWLHRFELTVSGLPYEYGVEPEWEEHVRILREWNPEQGVYRVPEKFQLNINVPEDATGSYIVTVTGQEHHSFREVSNFSYFVLRIAGEPIRPQLTISEILVPEEITEYEPFQLAFRVNNEGPIDAVATISVVVPEEWEVDEPTQTLTIEKNDSTASAFSIIPTTTAGEVSLVVEYPFREEIIKFTKAGPYLIPTGATTTTLPPEEKPVSLLDQIVGYASALFDAAVAKFESIAGPYATSIVMGVIFVLFIIVVWLILDIIRFTKREKKKPEKMKPKPKKTKISEVGPNNFDVRLTEV